MTAVVDASALAAFLVQNEIGPAVATAMLPHSADLHLPQLAIVETVSVLRGLVRGGQLTPVRAERALADLASFPARRWPHEPLIRRTWQLRDHISAYDATYVVLAEALGATLITQDARLAAAVRANTEVAVTLVSAPAGDPG